MNIKGRFGLYIHWPFCLSKCPYCDFNVHVSENVDQEQWQQAYLKSLEHYAGIYKGTLSSIYFGGGTPSLMRPDLVQAIIDKARSLWLCVNDIEITLEANPTSIEAEKFARFKDAGVNRVSVGVQALNDKDLKFLGRTHTKEEAIKALSIASDTFERFSFDLIYARPEQTLKSWECELSEAIDLSKGHLSLYQLTIERNTPFHFDYAQGKFVMPKEELASDFYKLSSEVLGRAGMPAYEVSNHAVEGHQSNHNLNYWYYRDYIGIGPGAHGRLTLDGRKYATRDHHAPQSWLAWVEKKGCGVHPYTPLSVYDRFSEALMMGVRLYDGIDLKSCHEDWPRFVDMQRLQVVCEEGWATLDGGVLTCSVEGMLRLNALLPYILKPEEDVVLIAS